MKHLDFTIDFETCSLSANAAVMQVAVVPWFRDSETDPFENGCGVEPLVLFVDLRTCVIDGFDFDPETVRWWSSRNAEAKKAVSAGLPEPISDVARGIVTFLQATMEQCKAESMCLWSQGADFDIAILRNICAKYDIPLETVAPHTSFRDSRTMILETGRICFEKDQSGIADEKKRNMFFFPSAAYVCFEGLPEKYADGHDAHDALYDAMKTSWYTWQALRMLRV